MKILNIGAFVLLKMFFDFVALHPMTNFTDYFQVPPRKTLLWFYLCELVFCIVIYHWLVSDLNILFRILKPDDFFRNQDDGSTLRLQHLPVKTRVGNKFLQVNNS